MNEANQLNAANVFEVSVPSHFISLYNCSASVVSLFFMFHKRNNEILSFVEDVRSQTSFTVSLMSSSIGQMQNKGNQDWDYTVKLYHCLTRDFLSCRFAFEILYYIHQIPSKRQRCPDVAFMVTRKTIAQLQARGRSTLILQYVFCSLLKILL